MPSGTSSTSQNAPLADVETRDRVYRNLLSRLALSDCHGEGLRRRGLTDDEIACRQYVSLPKSGRSKFCNELFQIHGEALLSVPGFSRRNGQSSQPYLTLSGSAGLIVPVRDVDDRIVALKVRRDESDIAAAKEAGRSDAKYVYLSSKKCSGPGPGSPVHVPAGITRPVDRARMTEGELKADVATSRSGIPTISMPGVGCWRAALEAAQKLGATSIRLAFDADSTVNPHVAKPMRDCAEAIITAGLTLELERWPAEFGKGIDDVFSAGHGDKIEVLIGDAALAAVREVAHDVGVPDSFDSKQLKSGIEPYQPFPIKLLPQPMRGSVVTVAKAMGCDPSYVALPALSVAAGAIGNSRRILLKRGWTEPAIIWTAIVGESGTMKSPPLEWVTQAIRDREESALQRHAAAMEEFQAELLRHSAAVAEWKRKKSPEPPPHSPVAPVAQRCLTTDATIEAVAVLLADNSRGLSLVRDELAGFVSSFDQYKAKGGGDAAHWLSIHSGKSFVVDRKTGDRKTISVPRPAVSITGGTQPPTLRRVLTDGHIESGLAARLLFAWPPRQRKHWTEADISPALEAKFKTMIDGLFSLELQIDENGKRNPVVVCLTPAARAAWIVFYNEHAAEQADLSGELAAAWSKLECYAARLALVVHCVRVVSCDPSLETSEMVDEASIVAGIELSRWFGREARRVYAMLSETEQETEQRQLVEWIRTRGGSASGRELQQGLRRFKQQSSDYAEGELDRLAKAGIGIWEPVRTTKVGGRPSRRLRLSISSTVYETSSIADEERGFVDVDTQSEVEINLADDCGEESEWSG